MCIRDRLEIIVIDVRHGSAALVKFPDGTHVLCDGGSLSGSNRASETIARVMFHEQIDRLDAVLVSHADVDHFNGAPELFRRFPVGELWITAMMRQDDSPSVGVLLDGAEEAGVDVRTVTQGDTATIPTGKLRILGPGVADSRAWNLLGDNEMSMVLSLIHI